MHKTNKFSFGRWRGFSVVVAALMLPLAPLMADEVTWDMDGTQFTGVNGLQIGLDYYDVDFQAGSCLSLFSYCGGGGSYDLDFSYSDAVEASDELLAAIDDISLLADTPSSMFGVGGSFGIILTAYDDDGGGIEDVAVTYVLNGLNLLATGESTLGVDAVSTNTIWAVWTPASPH